VVQPAPRAVDPPGGTGFGIHDFKRPDGGGDRVPGFIQQFELQFHPAGHPGQVELPHAGIPPRRIRFAGLPPHHLAPGQRQAKFRRSRAAKRIARIHRRPATDRRNRQQFQ